MLQNDLEESKGEVREQRELLGKYSFLGFAI